MKAVGLRQSILQAAVQGKLVSQKANEESALELLKKIQQRKAQLIHEGKIRKEKPLPPIRESEIPYDLPQGWCWCRLGEVHFLFRGITFPGSVKAKSPFPGSVRCATTGSVQKKYMPNADVFVPAQYVKNDFQWLVRNDIIVSTANSKELVGKSCFWCGENQMTFGGFLTIIRVVSLPMIGRYSYYAFQYFQKSGLLASLANRTTNIANLNNPILANIPFPLPPAGEQRRIVAKLEELLILCDELEMEEKKLDELEAHFAEYLPKSILQDAVRGKLLPQVIHDEPASEMLKRIQQKKSRLLNEGKAKKEKPLSPISKDEIPYDLPAAWSWCRLRDLGQIVGGATPNSHNRSYYAETGKGIPWITPADMKYAKGNYIYCGAKDITEAGYNSCSTTKLPIESIVFSSRAPIGRIALVGKPLCTNQGFKSIVPYDVAMAPWIFYLLKSKARDIQSRASGTTFKEVSRHFMEKEIVPVPPLSEQQRIVAELDKLMILCKEMKAAYVSPEVERSRKGRSDCRSRKKE